MFVRPDVSRDGRTDEEEGESEVKELEGRRGNGLGAVAGGHKPQISSWRGWERSRVRRASHVAYRDKDENMESSVAAAVQ